MLILRTRASGTFLGEKVGRGPQVEGLAGHRLAHSEAVPGWCSPSLRAGSVGSRRCDRKGSLGPVVITTLFSFDLHLRVVIFI